MPATMGAGRGGGGNQDDRVIPGLEGALSPVVQGGDFGYPATACYNRTESYEHEARRHARPHLRSQPCP